MYCEHSSRANIPRARPHYHPAAANAHDHIPHIDKRDIRFASSDGTSSIHGFIWKPLLQDDTQPRALVQLVHGMSKHSGRYEAFATFLVDAGFAVCANDHIGHGGSVSGDGYGYLPPDKGVDIMLEDVDRMRQLAQEDVGASYTLMKLGRIAMSAKTAPRSPHPACPVHRGGRRPGGQQRHGCRTR